MQATKLEAAMNNNIFLTCNIKGKKWTKKVDNIKQSFTLTCVSRIMGQVIVSGQSTAI